MKGVEWLPIDIFGRAAMADAETPMEVESLPPVPHVDGAAATATGTNVDASMQQDGEEEKEEMPFTDDELAVCFKVSMLVNY